MADSPTGGGAQARAFLEELGSDESLSRLVDQAVDEQILTVSRALAAARGYHFSHEELTQAVVDRLALVEFELQDDGGAGKCKSDSGCRTPCVYCKSNRFPTQGDLGPIIEEQRGPQ